MKVHRNVDQGTPEWFSMRLGKATASCFSDVLAKGQGKTRASYMRRLLAEVLTGKPIETYRNGHMDRGQEHEPLAGMAYELATDHLIERVAFIEHDSMRAGCSPDGLIFGKKRGVEIKSVIPTVQIETITAGAYPSEHKAQVQGSMWITGYPEWDFCSYSHDMPKHLRTYIYTVPRDEAYIKELEAEVRRFLADVDLALERLSPQGENLEAKLRQSLVAA